MIFVDFNTPIGPYYDKRVARYNDTIVIFFAVQTPKNLLEIYITPVPKTPIDDLYDNTYFKLREKYVYLSINDKDRMLIDVTQKTKIVYNETLKFEQF